MRYDDIIDGLRVIEGRRGKPIQQGDVLIVQAAIKALVGRSEYCVVCNPRPFSTAAREQSK
jgi:hypothetical protein